MHSYKELACIRTDYFRIKTLPTLIEFFHTLLQNMWCSQRNSKLKQSLMHEKNITNCDQWVNIDAWNPMKGNLNSIKSQDQSTTEITFNHPFLQFKIVFFYSLILWKWRRGIGIPEDCFYPFCCLRGNWAGLTVCPLLMPGGISWLNGALGNEMWGFTAVQAGTWVKPL